MPKSWAWLLFALAFVPARASAQDLPASESLLFAPSDPFAAEVRLHFYAELRRSPGKAFLWELALPGAGSVYTHLYANAIVTGALSLLGASLWIAGAARDHDRLWWAGAGSLAAARGYGLISAPIGAGLLNRAYRRQLGLVPKR